MMSACGMSLSRRCRGKVGLTELMPAMRWFLKVWIALSSTLRQWSPTGVSWKYINSFNISDASLSSHCRRGWSPRDCRRRMPFLYAAKIWCLVRDGIGSACM